jgi:hypothetical protein
MPYMSTLVHGDHVLTGPVRPRTPRDRGHLATLLRTRRSTREIMRAGAQRGA